MYSTYLVRMNLNEIGCQQANYDFSLSYALDHDVNSKQRQCLKSCDPFLFTGISTWTDLKKYFCFGSRNPERQNQKVSKYFIKAHFSKMYYKTIFCQIFNCNYSSIHYKGVVKWIGQVPIHSCPLWVNSTFQKANKANFFISLPKSQTQNSTQQYNQVESWEQ